MIHLLARCLFHLVRPPDARHAVKTFPNMCSVQQRIDVSVMLELGVLPGSCKQRAKCAFCGDWQKFYLFSHQ